MEQLLAYCGLDCAVCDAFRATRQNDDALRAHVAAQWSQMTGRDFSPEDVNCDGCSAGDGRTAPYLNECPIRNCARERDVPNCGHCAELPCERLAPVFEHSAEARANLDSMRRPSGPTGNS
ncbi:MAG: DUF3795 domain-containing protein [Candidatus Brocadiia bacterium]